MPEKKVVLEQRKFKQGEALFTEGEPGTEAYLITSGYVAIWRMEAGQRVSLAERGEGEIVGEMALVDEAPRSANVTAETEVSVHIIRREQLQLLLDAAPKTLTTILHQLLESLRTANDLIAMYASRLSAGKGA